MHLYLRFAILMLTVGTCYVYAHQYVHSWQVKSENALIISWLPLSEDPTAPQITISDQLGHVITSLNVHQPVPEASRVSIYDVSARGNMVAVAAVYQSKEGNRRVRPAASLLLFDLSGQLVSAFTLEPSHAIRLLAVDNNSNIWTLTDHADKDVDPSTVPMVVEYTPTGKIVREMLTRDMFPSHALDIKESIETGAPAMGCDSGVVWFWLPGSTDFVTISVSDGKTAMMKTQLPKTLGRRIVPLGIEREPSGDVVMNVREDDDQRRAEVKSNIAYYRWSSPGAWSQFKPGACDSARLIGAGEKGQVYVRDGVDRTDICVFESR